MCPLVAAPNRGYADWQRVENYDSAVLWALAQVSQPGPVVSPIMDVSRYAYLGGLIGNGSASIQLVNIQWFMDAGATILIGQRSFAQNGQMPNSAQLRLPNLGPFCRVTITSTAGGNIGPVAELFGTNRVHPCEMVPLDPYLLNLNQSFPTGTTPNFFRSYYAGPAMMTCVMPSSGVGISFNYTDELGAAQQYDQLNVVTGAAIQRQIVVVPAGIVWANVINISGAAQGVALYVIPSTTGAT